MTHEPTRRDRLMAALATAEHLVSASPAEPDDVDIRQGYSSFDFDEIGVVFYFHDAPAALQQFAAAMGTAISHRRGEADGRTYLETTTTGRLDNIPFYTWAREALPTLGQLAEQRHQVEEPAVPLASAAPRTVQVQAVPA